MRFPVTWDSSVSHRVEVATVADFAASRLGVDPIRRAVGAGLAERDRAERARGDRRPGVHRPDPHPGGGPGAAGLVSAGRRALRAGRRMAAALPAAADGGPDRRVRRRARLPAAERGLAGDVVWLAFTLSRRWAPYAKWRGTVFRSLPVAASLGPLLDAPPRRPWRERENALAAACGCSRRPARTRAAGARSAVISFFDRPYRTVDGAVPRPPGRHHRPGRQRGCRHGGLHRAVGGLHGRLVQPGPPGRLADGLPSLGQHAVTRRRCRRRSSGARWRRQGRPPRPSA